MDITPTEHDKNEWSRLAAAAYKIGRNDVGHRYSMAATLSEGERCRITLYDTLQEGYRAWLNWHEFPKINEVKNG